MKNNVGATQRSIKYFNEFVSIHSDLLFPVVLTFHRWETWINLSIHFDANLLGSPSLYLALPLTHGASVR